MASRRMQRHKQHLERRRTADADEGGDDGPPATHRDALASFYARVDPKDGGLHDSDGSLGRMRSTPMPR